MSQEWIMTIDLYQLVINNVFGVLVILIGVRIFKVLWL